MRATLKITSILFLAGLFFVTPFSVMAGIMETTPSSGTINAGESVQLVFSDFGFNDLTPPAGCSAVTYAEVWATYGGYGFADDDWNFNPSVIDGEGASYANLPGASGYNNTVVINPETDILNVDIGEPTPLYLWWVVSDDNGTTPCGDIVLGSYTYNPQNNTGGGYASSIGGTGKEVGVKAGEAVKNGLPVILVIAASLIGLGILMFFVYQFIGRPETNSAKKRGAIMGFRGATIKAPKGYHYVNFTKSNGEKTSYIFKD